VTRGATLRLAEAAAAVDSGAFRAETTTTLRRAVLDWTACTVAGAPGAASARTGLLEGEGPGPSSVLGTGTSAAAPLAAFLNGFACHVLEFDDLHGPSIYHPGAPTIAAALAMAERSGAAPERFAAGVVAGYEVGIRLGEAAGKPHYARFHSTGTVGAVGAAVAAARVLGLPGPQIADAIGIAATQAAGLWSYADDGAPTKPVHPGHAAMVGVVAASLAAGGLRGPRLALEGPRGFLATLGGDPAAPVLTERLGSAPLRIEALTLKAYPCCGHTHPGIDAARTLHGRLPAGRTIAGVVLTTYASALEVAGVANPETPAQAAFSYSHVLAWALLHGSIEDAFAPAALLDPAVLALRTRVSLAVDPGMDADYPSSQPAHLSVTLDDGSQLEAFERFAPGSPLKPMAAADFDAKLALLLGPGAGPWRAYAEALCGKGPELPAPPGEASE